MSMAEPYRTDTYARTGGQFTETRYRFAWLPAKMDNLAVIWLSHYWDIHVDREWLLVR